MTWNNPVASSLLVHPMSRERTSIQQHIEHVFRHESGKLVATLTRIFGAHLIQLAEDVVQDAMLEAVNQWSYSGVPDNPTGWI